MTISFIIPTIGRQSLINTLASIETRPGDEILVVGDGEQPNARVICTCFGAEAVTYLEHGPTNQGGNAQRNAAMAIAKGDYLAFIDDDDWYRTGHRDAMEKAMIGRPVLFRMAYSSGHTLWQDATVRQGNFGTPMMFLPNDRAMLGSWSSERYESDFDFFTSMKWPLDQVLWRPDVVAQVGHPA